MQLASLGYRTDLVLLQLGGSTVEDRGDHLVVSSPHAPQHWWGNFLLLEAVPRPQACQAWLDSFAAAFPQAGHVAIGFDGTHGGVEQLRWFAQRGHTAEALTVMTAGAVRPPGHRNRDAIYRRLVSDDDWARSLDLRVRCRRPELEPAPYRAFAAEKAQTNRRVVATGHGAWFGAFVDGRLVAQLGLVSAGKGLARFQSVETDPDCRRRGLAGTLVHHASAYGLSVLAARTLVIVAEPTYFAIDLYRALGFEVTETQLMVERKPV